MVRKTRAVLGSMVWLKQKSTSSTRMIGVSRVSAFVVVGSVVVAAVAVDMGTGVVADMGTGVVVADLGVVVVVPDVGVLSVSVSVAVAVAVGFIATGTDDVFEIGDETITDAGAYSAMVALVVALVIFLIFCTHRHKSRSIFLVLLTSPLSRPICSWRLLFTTSVVLGILDVARFLSSSVAVSLSLIMIRIRCAPSGLALKRMRMGMALVFCARSGLAHTCTIGACGLNIDS